MEKVNGILYTKKELLKLIKREKSRFLKQGKQIKVISTPDYIYANNEKIIEELRKYKSEMLPKEMIEPLKLTEVLPLLKI